MYVYIYRCSFVSFSFNTNDKIKNPTELARNVLVMSVENKVYKLNDYK